MSDRFKIIGKDIYCIEDTASGWETYYFISKNRKFFRKIQMQQTSTGGEMVLRTDITYHDKIVKRDLKKFIREQK